MRPQGYSQSLQRAIVDFGSECSFEKASKRLRLHHYITLSATTIRRVTLAHGKLIQQKEQVSSGHGRLPRAGAESIIAQIDGSMLPIVECLPNDKGNRRRGRKCDWEEIRLCAARVNGELTTHYGVTKGSCELAGYTWAHTVAKANWGMNSKLHVVCDGATWIVHQCREQLGEQADFLVDFYHVMDYLVAAKKAHTHKRWLNVQKKRLKTNHPERVLKALQPYLEAPHIHNDDAPVRAAYRYLNNRLDQLNYKDAIENELPIGSGMIEGGHRHVIQQRLKISGSWWLRENAEAMAHLRVCRANEEEDSYWRDLAKAA